MSGFSNPIANAAGTLIRTVMKSINYVVGLTGWAIFKNGDAEFNNGSFRGIVKVRAVNGSEIDIDPSFINPQIILYSPDGTNNSFINVVSGVPSGSQPSFADLGINSGIYTPADGIPRRGRIWMADSLTGSVTIGIIKQSNQSLKGGYSQYIYNAAFFGYWDADAALNTYLSFQNGQSNFSPNQNINVPASSSFNVTTVNHIPYLSSPKAMTYSQPGVAGSTSSNVPSVMPGTPGVIYPKVLSTTALKVSCFVGVFASVAPVTLMLYAHADDGAGNVQTVQLSRYGVPGTFTYYSAGGVVSFGNGFLQAGNVTVTLYWATSSGTVNQDGAGWTSIEVMEITP